MEVYESGGYNGRAGAVGGGGGCGGGAAGVAGGGSFGHGGYVSGGGYEGAEGAYSTSGRVITNTGTVTGRYGHQGGHRTMTTARITSNGGRVDDEAGIRNSGHFVGTTVSDGIVPGNLVPGEVTHTEPLIAGSTLSRKAGYEAEGSEAGCCWGISRSTACCLAAIVIIVLLVLIIIITVLALSAASVASQSADYIVDGDASPRNGARTAGKPYDGTYDLVICQNGRSGCYCESRFGEFSDFAREQKIRNYIPASVDANEFCIELMEKHGWTRDGAIEIISAADNDGDGIIDSEDIDGDNDGIPDFIDADDDNDGIPDNLDNDDDNDGIPDSEEGLDTDGDGILDAVDDNDGIPDEREIGFDGDGDGIPDADDNDDDNDGVPDNIDNDDDNDGIPDSEEANVNTGTKCQIQAAEAESTAANDFKPQCDSLGNFAIIQCTSDFGCYCQSAGGDWSIFAAQEQIEYFIPRNYDPRASRSETFCLRLFKCNGWSYHGEQK